MSLIDRYVIRQVLKPFLLGLLVFTFIFIIPELMRIAEQLVAKGVEVDTIVQLALLLVPYALSLTIPMSLLLALLVGFGRLSADREFVAMQACGVSLLRLLRPVGIIAVGGWAATTYILIVGVPEANQAFRQIAFDVTAQRAEGEVKPRVFFTQFPDLTLYVQEVPRAGGWKGVFLADSRKGQESAVYLADTGRVVIDSENQRVDLVLDRGIYHSTNGDVEYDASSFDRLVLSVNPAAILNKSIDKGLNEMTVAELRAEIAEKERTIDPTTGMPFSTHNERMAIHQKFSIPVACLVFGLIGLALGATHRRDGMLGSFVLGIIVIFAYYVPLYLGPQMVKGGLLPIWLGKWLPNIVLGVLGVMMFVWRGRVADQPFTLTVPTWLKKRSASGALLPAMPGVKSLDRYVITTYVRLFALTTAALIGIFYLTTFLQLSDKVFKGTASWTMVGEYFWYASPQWFYYVIPFAALLAVLVTIALLTKNSELIVMKACGISLYRIAAPMFVTAAIVGASLFAMEETILGAANRRAEELRFVIRGGEPDAFDLLHQRWLVGTEGQIYHYLWLDPQKQMISGLSTYEFSPGMKQITRRSYINLATYTDASEEDPRDGWTVENGWTRDFAEDGTILDYQTFVSDMRRLETPEYFGTKQPEPEFMRYSELRAHVKQLAASGFDVVDQEVALGRKLAFPFVTIVMTVLAVPFGVTIGRSGAMGGIGVGIALAFVYWTVISVFVALGAGGALSPALAAWAPNLIFASAALYALLTVRT